MDPSIKKTLLKEALKEDENIISNIISEYSQELEAYFEGKDLTLMRNKLTTIIKQNIGLK